MSRVRYFHYAVLVEAMNNWPSFSSSHCAYRFILNILFSRPKNSGLLGHFFHTIGLLFSLLKHKFLNLFQFYCVILKLMIRSALKTWTTHIHSQWNYKVFLLIHYTLLNNSNIPFSRLFQMTKLIIKNVFVTRSYAVASHSHSFNMEGQKGFLGDNLGDFFAMYILLAMKNEYCISAQIQYFICKYYKTF